MISDALILAGGDGNRFKKTNASIIKPLYKVNDKELIRYSIDPLIKLGIESIYINENQNDDLSIMSKYYGNIIKYIKVDNTKGPVNSLYNCFEYLGHDFILCDCDIFVDEKSYIDMLNYGISKINECDGLVACSENSLLENNGYIDIKDEKVVCFNKKGICKYNGGFTYVMSERFKDFIIKNKDNEHMSILLDEFFKNYNVLPMYIDTICDIDSVEDAEKIEMKLKRKCYK